MQDERDYPSYSRNRSSYVLFIKSSGASFFLCGTLVAVCSIFASAEDGGAGLFLSAVIASVAITAFCSQSDFFFKRLAESKLTAKLFPLFAYTCIIVGSFFDYPIGIAIQSVGLTFSFQLWLVAFETKKRILASVGIVVLLSGLSILAILWLHVSVIQLPDMKVISLILLLISAVIYFALPLKRVMPVDLLLIDKKQSLEHLPNRHDKSMILFGLLRGLLIGYSVYIVLSSVPETPAEIVICLAIGALCLFVLVIQLFSAYENSSHNAPPKQIELFTSSLFWIVSLLALIAFVRHGIAGFTAGILILLYSVRRSIYCADFATHWAFIFRASPVVAHMRSLIGAFSGIALGWALAALPFYIDWTAFDGGLTLNHLISIAMIAVIILVVSKETTNRLASTQDEVKNLIGEIAARDEAAYQLEKTIVTPKNGSSSLSAQVSSNEIYFKQSSLQLNAESGMYHHAFAESLKLTNRQAEVLVFLLKGRNTTYICNQLFISSATTRSHVQSIYKKAGVHSQDKLMEKFDDFVLRIADKLSLQ